MKPPAPALPERALLYRRVDPTRPIRPWRRLIPSGRRRVKVLVHRGDPYLALLLRLQLPGGEMSNIDDEDAAIAALEERPALVVTPVRPGSRFLERVLGLDGRPPVVGLVDSDGARPEVPEGLDQVLLRPFLPGELHQAVRRALRLPDPRPPRPLLPLARRLIAGIRLGTVAIAAVLMVNAKLPSWRAAVLAGAFAYATLRLPVPRWPRVAAIADACIAAGLVVATGGQSSVFIPFALALTIGAGLDVGTQGGLSVGGSVSLISFPVLAYGLLHKTTRPTDVLVYFALFPLAGLAGGYARYVLGGADPEGSSLFAEANRMLSALYRLTRSMPGGLETSTVARAAVGEIAEMLHAQASAVLIEEGGALIPAAAYSIDGIEDLAVHPNEGPLGAAAERSTPTFIDAESLSPPHRAVLKNHPRWLVAPVRRGGAVLGLLLAASPDEAEGSARAKLQRIAAEAGVAIENARLFTRVRGLTIDAERRRLARDIHDGVAQALAHIRFELDHLRRHVVEKHEVAIELERLGRVVERAGDDVRATIVGLRSGIAIGRRLVPALQSYLDDLRGLGGPEIEFLANADPLLPEEVAAESFRIAQEAVSNALRHAGAKKIVVSVSAQTDSVVLEVYDDGKGFDDNGATAGIGLTGMKERASQIGATLEVTPRSSGGVGVRLIVPKEVRQ